MSEAYEKTDAEVSSTWRRREKGEKISFGMHTRRSRRVYYIEDTATNFETGKKNCGVEGTNVLQDTTTPLNWHQNVSTQEQGAPTKQPHSHALVFGNWLADVGDQTPSRNNDDDNDKTDQDKIHPHAVAESSAPPPLNATADTHQPPPPQTSTCVRLRHQLTTHLKPRLHVIGCISLYQ